MYAASSIGSATSSTFGSRAGPRPAAPPPPAATPPDTPPLPPVAAPARPACDVELEFAGAPAEAPAPLPAACSLSLSEPGQLQSVNDQPSSLQVRSPIEPS